MAATYQISGLTEINEGEYQLTLSVQGAPASTIQAWNIDWADGSPVQQVNTNGAASISVTHNMDGDAPQRRVTATATLTGGGTVIAESRDHSGNLDATFGDGGTTVDTAIGTPKAVVVDADGGTIVAYQGENSVRLRRYTASGAVDGGWGNDAASDTAIVPFTNNTSGDELSLLIHGGLLYVGGESENSSGNTDFAIARFGLATGTLDNSWDGDGLKLFDIAGDNDLINALASQGGNVIATGIRAVAVNTVAFAMIRIGTDGVRDTTFGTAGVATSAVANWAPEDVAVLADGSIVAAGTGGLSNNLVVQKFTAAGTSVWFNNTIEDGIGDFSPTPLAVQPDGKIVVASQVSTGTGYDIFLARLNADGSLDSDFVDSDPSNGNPAGVFSYDSHGAGGFDAVFDLALQPDGTIVTLGGSQNRFAVHGFREFHGFVMPDGNFGAEFARTLTDFEGFGSEIRAAAVTPGGSIVAAGYSDFAPDNTIALARYGRDLGLSVVGVSTTIVTEDNVFIRPNEPLTLQVDEPGAADRAALYQGYVDFDFQGDEDGDGISFGGFDPDTFEYAGEAVPSHTYTSPGTYRVFVFVADKDNAGSIREFYVHVGTGNYQQVVPDPVHPGQSMLLIGADDGPAAAGVANKVMVTSVAGGTAVNIDGVTGVHPGAISRVVLYGNGGDDVLQVKGSLAVPIEIYGGAGNDKLKGDVFADILVGGTGDDLVTGDPGRDLIIGGEGADKLVGNADDDILIGGTYTQSGRRQAASAVVAEWAAARTYQQRVDNLRDGTGTEARLNQLRDTDGNLLEEFYLSNDRLFKTVVDDFAEDRLTGNAGQDWFFANVEGPILDKVTDLSSSEFTDEDRNFINEL